MLALLHRPLAFMAVTRSSLKSSNKESTRQKADSGKNKLASASASKKCPERTSDGRYIIVKNRKWRATDPSIPEEALTELKHHLAKGRASARAMVPKGKTEEDDDIRLSRKRTGLAKLGLGERGKPEWWNDTTEGRRARWEDALKELTALPER